MTTAQTPPASFDEFPWRNLDGTPRAAPTPGAGDDRGYTPTTDRVRFAATHGDSWLAYSPESFDRWLTAHDAERDARIRAEVIEECAQAIVRHGYSHGDMPDVVHEYAAILRALRSAAGGQAQTTEEWTSGRWAELTSDTEDGEPIGDTIRLTWPDGTRVVGRLTVPSRGSGHHQICRMSTVFGGDTWVWPHGSTLEVQTTEEADRG